ncbi:serum response factor-like isoform X2 [Dunckerocampus dactyliophorus]|uniref:serum response factor-like isoform X2 n=1 Tax=Dunckerocampus dactyliophorus TaxID=161453 RepID=UPI0024072DF5|nr:serum response factor-like isoform X2 [Dunckerocampus dactyliophorus]
MGTRTGPGQPGNGTATEADGGRFEVREYGAEVIDSGSEQDSESGEDEDPHRGSSGARRGVKRERDEWALAQQSSAPSGGLSGVHGGVTPGMPGAKPGKKTRGRVKIKMAFIDNKLRRYTTFSKRKTGIMKKAYELSTLTGTQVLLLVASETGHVYTFATRKLQPMITSETGKALIQTCLNSPDSPPRSDPSSDQRMSATGFEETDLTYQVNEADGCPDITKDLNKAAFSTSNMACSTTSSSATMQVQTSAASWQPSSTNGGVLKTSAGVVFPAGFTLMSGGGVSQQLQNIQVQSSSQPTSTNESSSDIHSPTSSTATVVSSSSSVATHMMYPGGHTVMYAAPTPSLGDGGLTVLNTFSQAGHTQSHDSASVPQVFLASLPPVTAQIPVSAVQLHPMVISQQSAGGGGGNLTELQVVSVDVQHAKED